MSETTSETGALTVDQAVAALLPAEPVEQAAPEAPAEAAAEPEQSEDGDQPSNDAEGEAETPPEGEETEAEPEAVVPADPPKYWSKDAKEAFAALPPELQAVVLAQEGPREEAASKAKAEAAEKAKAADAEVAKVSQLAQHLAEFLPDAIETFRSRWGDQPDWVAVAQEHGAEAMTLAKAQHDAELGKLQKLAAAKQDAEAQAHSAFLKAEFAKLQEIAPDLADPEKGPENRRAVTEYLNKHGVDQDALRHISATELLIADKARRWDEAQAKLSAAPPKPKPAAPAPRSPVRPAASAGAPNQSKQAAGRFHQAPTVDNAVALLLAPKG